LPHLHGLCQRARQLEYPPESLRLLNARERLRAFGLDRHAPGDNHVLRRPWPSTSPRRPLRREARQRASPLCVGVLGEPLGAAQPAGRGRHPTKRVIPPPRTNPVAGSWSCCSSLLPVTTL